MTEDSKARVNGIYRYPVKGLSPDVLATARLAPGEAIAWDRAYAIENGPGRFDPTAPRHLPKIHFLMLMRNERLAALDTHFDEGTGVLTVRRNGRQVARGALGTRLGRQMIEQFLAGYMGSELRGAPRIVHAAGHSFSDVAEKCVHIVNLATLSALERSLGRTLDPLRFRANIYLEAERPWMEFDWVDGEISIGAARLQVFARTGRCEATNVAPGTGQRDMAIPAALMRAFGHGDVGVYARVLEGAVIRPGDAVAAAPASAASSGGDVFRRPG